MSYGLLVRNSGTKDIVIDGRAPNYVLTAHNLATTNTAGPGLGFTSVSVPLPSSAKTPVVATSSAAGSYGIVYAPAAGAKTITLVSPGVTGTQIEYWVFDDPDTVPAPTGWGLVVRNPDTKKVVFAIGQKPMRVVDFPIYGKGLTPASPPAGRTYAYVAVGISGTGTGHTFPGPGPGPWTYVEDRQALAINGATLSVVSAEYRENTQPNTVPMPPNFVINANALLLDVTGY